MKFVLCGDGSVGKTTLRHAYFGHEFKASYLMTIGADFSVKNVPISRKNNPKETIKVQFWDLAGQPRFSKVRSMYYPGSHGALLIYDCTLLESFENIVNWLEELKKHLGDRIPVVLIANKIDLRTSVPISVSSKQGKALAKAIGKYYLLEEFIVPYIETSAKFGANVDQAFHSLVEMVVQKYSV